MRVRAMVLLQAGRDQRAPDADRAAVVEARETLGYERLASVAQWPWLTTARDELRAHRSGDAGDRNVWSSRRESAGGYDCSLSSEATAWSAGRSLALRDGLR